MTARLLLRSLTLLGLLLVSTPALAGGFELQVHGFYLLDVIILVTILGAFLKGPARTFLENRHETAKLEMEEAMSVKTESEARLSKYETALSNLDSEISELNASFEADGAREAQRIAAEGEATGEKLRRDAAETLAREGAQVKGDIERSVATKALTRAEAMILDRLDDAQHKRLIESFITDLESREDLGSFKVTG